MALPIILVILLSATLLAGFTHRLPQRALAYIVPLPAFVSFLILVFSTQEVLFSDKPITFQANWVPTIDLQFSLMLDAWRWLLAFLVTGIGSLILLYTTGYMAGHAHAHRLVSYLYGFMLGMAGLAFADHLIILFVFWELTSITSYLLIGFNHKAEDSRKSALQALLITGMGGMALLASFILLNAVTGHWLISELVNDRTLIIESAFYPAIIILVFLGALTKSAQFPFHFWLPNAMAAPTPVSAYLHSATMVKAGIFLLALFLPIIGGTDYWKIPLITLGSITLILGGLFGLRQSDLKKILAGTTVAVLGLLTVLLGIGSEKAVLALVLFLIGHALYKASLFMIAGSVDHETGTRDTRILGNLRKYMPWTAAAALIAGFSKMGLPPFFGFLGKEYTYKAGLSAEFEWVVVIVMIVGNALILALAIKTAILPFWRKPSKELPKKAHEAPFSLVFPPLLLAVTGLVIGVFPQLIGPLLTEVNSSILGYPVESHVKLWHGFNLPLLLSALTVSLGIIIAFQHKRIQSYLQNLKIISCEDVYGMIIRTIVHGSKNSTQRLQTGYLHHYIIAILATAGLLIAFKLWRFGGPAMPDFTDDFSIPATLITIIMMGATLFTLTTKSRLTALISLGLIGFGVALIFALYSAPDLAITQILIETLTVVFFAWVVSRLPPMKVYSSKRAIQFDAVFSIIIGVLMTLLILKSNTIEMGTRISEQLSLWSYAEAHGRNIVNVILVDFRALDTWGEICVLAIAGIGVWALLQKSDKEKDTK